MLCPEVWSFEAPESNFKTEKSGIDANTHLKTINSLTYSHLVSATLPDTAQLPAALFAALTTDCDYYKVTGLKINELVSRNFINNFVNSGNLYILSVGARIDCDNCIAVTPRGQLILSLNKLTYSSLGLEGKVSHFQSKSKNRYLVVVDLKSKSFKPGKPNYERVKERLEQFPETFTTIVAWEPCNDEICPSSIAKYFHDLRYDVKLCPIKLRTHTRKSVHVPELHEVDPDDFVEWLGMIALEADLITGSPDNFITTYEVPKPNVLVPGVKYLQWRGFFTIEKIQKLFNVLRQFQKESNCRWIALYVQGFSDSPVAWGVEEHHYYTNGDNSYTIILDGKYCTICSQRCSKKQYKSRSK